MAFMASREGKQRHHFIQVFVYSSILKHFTDVEPGALMLKFSTTVWWIISFKHTLIVIELTTLCSIHSH